jgi:hypothetical protein
MSEIGEMADRREPDWVARRVKGDRHEPDWVARRRKGNRIIGLVLFALVIVYVGLFVARYVIK